MKTKIFTLIFCIAAAGMFIAGTTSSRSLCDSPLIGAGHAGDPGNPTCKGCHTGPAVNSGIADLSLQIPSSDGFYEPGRIYDFELSIMQPNLAKAGFEIVALLPDNSSAGALILTDTQRTRLTTEIDREYVTSTPCGADVNMTGMNMWSFQWRAPYVASDTVTLYLAALATNHNDAVTGDTTYTRVLKLAPRSLSGIEDVQNSNIRLFPNPATDHITLAGLEQEKDLTLSILDMQGKIVLASLVKDVQKPVSIDLNSPKALPSGSYLLRIGLGNKEYVRRFIKQ